MFFLETLNNFRINYEMKMKNRIVGKTYNKYGIGHFKDYIGVFLGT